MLFGVKYTTDSDFAKLKIRAKHKKKIAKKILFPKKKKGKKTIESKANRSKTTENLPF